MLVAIMILKPKKTRQCTNVWPSAIFELKIRDILAKVWLMKVSVAEENMLGYQISSSFKHNWMTENVECKFYSNCWNYGGFKRFQNSSDCQSQKPPIDGEQTNTKSSLVNKLIFQIFAFALPQRLCVKVSWKKQPSHSKWRQREF